MLIDFTVENFRSFKDEASLNMIAGAKFKDHPNHCVDIGETSKQVLKTGLIFGANASGKSNLVKAIGFARDLVVLGSGAIKKIAMNQFRFLESEAEHRPSTFDFRFLVGKRLFQYGFSLNDEEVTSEWLSATSDSGRDLDIFNREKQEVEIGNLKTFGETASVSHDALKALKQLGVRSNQLLLNKIVDLDIPKRGKLLNSACWWFTDCLTIIEPNSNFAALLTLLKSDPDFCKFAEQFLETAGTGIGSLTVETAEIESDRLPSEIVESLQSAGELEDATYPLGAGSDLSIDIEDPGKIVRRNLLSGHKVGKSEYKLAFSDESDGTQRFLNLLPALFYLSNHCHVFVIDELDRSLHPMLSHRLLKFFTEACPGKCQQMIVTTHETHLLDLDLLRRDEIWFMEKDAEQQSKLISLANMNVRKDMRIEKGYLHGRFGGVPEIGNTDRLMDLLSCEVEVQQN